MQINVDRTGWEDAQRLQDLGRKLRAAMTKAGISAPHRHSSRMVRGWSECTDPGVKVSVGFDWEKDGYNHGNVERLRKNNRARDGEFTYRWNHPTRILLEGDMPWTCKADGSIATRVHEWIDQAVRIAQNLGLEVVKQGTSGAEFKLRGAK